MTTCPCCGQGLKEALPVDSLVDVPLSTMRRSIVDALIRSYPRGLSVDQIAEAVYQSPWDEPDDVRSSIHVTRFKINIQLRDVGWSVANLNNNGRGNLAKYALRSIV